MEENITLVKKEVGSLNDYHHLMHQKQQTRSGKTLWAVLWITLFFTVVEVIGGVLSRSLALLSDSAHMLSDVLALGLSMTAIQLARRAPNSRFTFGYLRFEIIAAFLNGLALAVISIGIFAEGIRRLIRPQAIDFPLMLTVAVIGLTVNVVLTVLLSRSMAKENNLNVQSALWHFIGDLLNSVGVIAAALLVRLTGWTVFDPLISIVIAAVIFAGGVRILKESFLVLMEAVPKSYDLAAVKEAIMVLPDVLDVHETHLWEISTDHVSFTAHVLIRPEADAEPVILAITDRLKETFGIVHVTVQPEKADIHPHGAYGDRFRDNV